MSARLTALPELTLAAGGSVAIVTQSATAYDDEAAVRIAGDVAEELPALLAELGMPLATGG